jgi:hypothetical protein
MPGQTIKLRLPYALLEDGADIEAAVRPLAEALDGAALITSGTAAPPAQPQPVGVQYYRETSGILYFSTGTAWLPLAFNQPGSIPTSALVPDAGILQSHLAAEVVNNEVPIGGVIDWWRPVATVPVPPGFEICDGHSVTPHDFPNVTGSVTLPDLRNTFILGADVAKTDGAGAGGSSSDAAADAPGIRGTGGSNAHTLTTSQLATHSHGGATVAGLSGTENTTLSHQHTGGTGGMSVNASHLHGAAPGYNFIMTPGTSGNQGVQSGSGAVVVAVQLGTAPASGSTTNSTNTDHTHGFTTNAGGPAAHSHNIPALTINPDGSGSAHNNMPKWAGLLRIMKVRRV